MLISFVIVIGHFLFLVFAPPRDNSNAFVDSGGPVVIILAIGSEVRGFKLGRCRWIFSDRKIPEYNLLQKGSKAVGPVSCVVDLRHVKVPQAEIRASEQNLSDF